ncbi:MAG: response regulator [Candidatus Hydrogenedentes bacterium]|nr:response regulator [Candidatus Hydrogenedentota bacterium]
MAKYCHVTADTIRKWAEAGRIRVFKTPGGHRRIRSEDLIEFLHENGIPLHPDLSSSGTRILVIESERSVVAVVRRFLERSQTPFEVEVAMDCFDAGYRMATFQPDVVLVDVETDGMDGVELCQRVKASSDHGAAHVIALGGADSAEAMTRAIEQGASAELMKPFTPDDLRRILAKVGIEVT